MVNFSVLFLDGNSMVKFILCGIDRFLFWLIMFYRVLLLWLLGKVVGLWVMGGFLLVGDGGISWCVELGCGCGLGW